MRLIIHQVGRIIITISACCIPCDNSSFDVKPYADDTSLFSVVENEVVSSVKLNRDLEILRLWAWQCKIELIVEKIE